MGRPPLPVGTAGQVRYYRTGDGWCARCKYRDYDGVTRYLERAGHTKNAADSALKEAVRDRSLVIAAGAVSGETRIANLAEVWVATKGELSPRTVEAYKYQLDNHIVPVLGRLRVRETSIGAVDRFLNEVKARNGASQAKMCRSVLSGMLGLAARHDAIDRNPVRDVGSISVKPKKRPMSVDFPQIKGLLAALDANEPAVKRDLPDFVRFMVATGLRIGEASAIIWACVDLENGTVKVNGTVIRTKGEGLRIKPEPKSKAGERILELPTWAIEMLKRRRTSVPSPGHVRSADASPVFPAILGGLRDPSNTQADLRQAFTAAGFPDATSDTLRRSVATLMDAAGLSARAAADQLGHAQVSVTQDRYFGRSLRATGAAAVTEHLA